MDHPVPAPRNPKNINLRRKRPERPPRKRDIELRRPRTNTEYILKNCESALSTKPTISIKTEDTAKNCQSTPELITKEYPANTTTNKGTNDVKKVYRNSEPIIDQKVDISKKHDSKLNRLSSSPASLTLPAPLVEIKPWRSTKN
ncbi:hypothetical protein Trydic_g1036 [Trypoxylus dichotomus]